MTWVYEHYRDATAIGFHTTQRLHHEVSPFQTIDVHQTIGNGKLLTLDGMVMVTELDEFVYHEALVHAPMCLHPDPKRILVVGGGDGGTVREVLRHDSVESIELCEIDERVTLVCEEHFPTVASEIRNPKVRCRFEDAIAFVATCESEYDVIMVDGSEPVGPAEGLFERAFFESLKRALRPGGVLSAQAESPLYAPEVVSKTFGGMREVFQHVHAYTATCPTYPGGLWTFCLASEDRALEQMRPQALAGLPTRYFNPQSLRASFMLPTFVAELTR